jgi:hypothetical protein
MWTTRHPHHDKVVARLCASATTLAVGGLVLATLAFVWQMLRTETFPGQYPLPIYPLTAIPNTALKPGDRGVAGADFSQVYTSAKAVRHGESAYRPTTPRYRDVYNRPPGYPPLMNYVAVPLSYLRYVDAYLLYTALAFLSLVAASGVLLWKVGLLHHTGRIALAQAGFLFLTPIGLTHLERGQFDLIVATAAVLCVGCVYLTSNPFGLAIAAGFLGALKWTSIAFLGCFSALGFLLSTGQRRWAFFTIPAVIVLGTLPFWRGLTEYWTTIKVYEIDAEPLGLTLQHFFSRNVSRALPVIMTVCVAGLCWLRGRTPNEREALLRQVAVPFAVALANLAICFGTLSYEYHTVTTLGMIPLLIVWVRWARGVPLWLKVSASLVYFGFQFVAFRSFGFVGVLAIELTEIYIRVALFFFLVCLYLTLRPRIAMFAR